MARELHPGRGIAYSADAHYTHSRMCGLLGVAGHPVAVDRQGRMDLGALEELLGTGRVGTVVLTAGTTGLGAIDPVHEALGLCQRHGARIHVDAAYGGFFTILARAEGAQEQQGAEGAQEQQGAGAAGQQGAGGWLPAAPWRAIPECDSVVVDPHKHGLQPYGCGAVLFRDPGVARFYLLTPRTPTSPPRTCTSVRSAWSAPGRARPPRRCGSRSGCCRLPRTGWGRSSRRGGGPRWPGPH